MLMKQFKEEYMLKTKINKWNEYLDYCVRKGKKASYKEVLEWKKREFLDAAHRNIIAVYNVEKSTIIKTSA